MKNFFSFFTILILIFLFNSCGSIKAIENHTGQGDIRIYETSFENLWTILCNIVETSDLIILKINKETGIIYGEGKASATSWGEYVGIWVSKNKDNSKCKVEIDIERKVKTNITAHQWGDEIFRKLDQQLFENF